MGERRYAYRVLVEKPGRKRRLVRPRRRWEDNIKINLGEVGSGHGLDRFGSGQRHMEGFCECRNEPSDFIKCGEILD
jgi:hypothetical protein